MKNVFQIRLENFREILLVEFERSKLKMGQKTGINSKYLYQLETERKRIGDDIARKIEVGTGKPVGWMDREHNARAIERTMSWLDEGLGRALRINNLLQAILSPKAKAALDALLQELEDRLPPK